jgi:hypothetical protein
VNQYISCTYVSHNGELVRLRLPDRSAIDCESVVRSDHLMVPGEPKIAKHPPLSLSWIRPDEHHQSSDVFCGDQAEVSLNSIDG